MKVLLLILQLLQLHFSVAKSYTKSKDAVLLSNVRTLTLQSGKKTTARRVSAIPQLTCVGGNGKGLYEVDVMRCKNSGSEYDPEDIQWTCQANLSPEFKLGSTEVVCEGFDSSADPYVLKGSCGVEYRLMLTDMGEEKYGSGGWFKNRVNEFSPTDRGSGSKSLGSMLFSVIFWIAFIGIVCLILYSVFNPQAQNRQPRNPLGGGGGGFWGGGGGGDDDPPPPYTPRAPPRSKPSSSTPRSSRSSNSGPGFWSGAGAGAAGGYMAGQYMANRANRQEQERQRNMFVAGPSNYGQGGSSWFGGGGGGGGSSAAGPSTAPSSSRYESTGFGGTRRR